MWMTEKGDAAWWVVAALLFLVWAGAVVASQTLGGAVHILLPLAVVATMLHAVRARRPPTPPL